MGRCNSRNMFHRAIAALLAVCCASVATAVSQCIATKGPGSTYTIAVIYKRNHPSSEAAKRVVQADFCTRFGVSPCQPTSSPDSSTISIVRDFDVLVPYANYTDVLVWFQQFRYELINGAGYSLDLMSYPNSGCPEIDSSLYAVHVGHKSPFNTNVLPPAANPVQMYTPASYTEDDSIFTSCSSDAECFAPYAPNTGCTGDRLVESMHFHFYVVSNNPAAVLSQNKYINVTTLKFDLGINVCPDNNGHEEAHNETCWLSGPGGSGPITGVSNKSSPGGSFNYPDFSLYVLRKDFADVLSWTMVKKNEADNGLADLDFLVHPNCGCNYADHVFWGLHASTYIPANRQGTAEEAGWVKTYAPGIDEWSIAHAGNAAVDGCGLKDDEHTFPSFALHVFYNAAASASVLAKNNFVKGLESYASSSGVQAQVGDTKPAAYADAASIALTSEQVVEFKGDSVEPLLPWILVHRPAAGVDIRLAPLSSGGQKCRYTDYVSRAMYAGEHWEINEHAVNSTTFNPLSAAADIQLSSPIVGAGDDLIDAELVEAVADSNCEFPPKAYILYMMSAAPNGYQMYAAGLDSYASGMTQNFLSKYNPVNCSSQYEVEPDYGDKVCYMGINTSPYHENSNPLLLSYSAVYVSATAMAEILSWAMDNRIAAKVYYDVELRLVPLTGCALTDYTQNSLKAGTDWRLNTAAL